MSKRRDNNPQITKLHLNAGMSKRVVDYIEANYPKTQIGWDSIGDYGTLTITNMNEGQIQQLIRQLNNIYPIEREDIISNPPPTSTKK